MLASDTALSNYIHLRDVTLLDVIFCLLDRKVNIMIRVLIYILACFDLSNRVHQRISLWILGVFVDVYESKGLA